MPQQRLLGPQQPAGRRDSGVEVDQRHQRLGMHGRALRMHGPLLQAAHLRRASPCADDPVLEFRAGLVTDCRSHGLPVHRAVPVVERERTQGRAAMMRGVRVQPDPAVAARIVAGDRIPGRLQAPAQRIDRNRKPARSLRAIDAHRRDAPRAARQQHRHGMRGRSDAGHGQVGHGEDRGQAAAAGDLHVGSRIRRQPQRRLDGGEHRCTPAIGHMAQRDGIDALLSLS